METSTARERMALGNPGEVANLDPAKAARFNAQTMFIPSALDVREAIAKIPSGQTKTVKQLGKELAQARGADCACPYAMTMAWLLVADAAEEARGEGTSNVDPYWRLTRDKKPEKRLPGGVESHRELLKAEGIEI